MTLSIPAHLKHSGNLNRIIYLSSKGCSAIEIQGCFARGGIHLKEVQGDFPVMANLPEMTRKALPKQVVKDYLKTRQQDALMPSVA